MWCCFSSCYYCWLWFRFWEHTQAVHACFVMSKHYCGFDKSIDDITHTYVIWSVIAFFVPIQCLLRLLCFGSFVLASVVAVIVAVRWSDLTSTIRLFNSLLASVQTSLPIRCVNMQTMLCTCCFLVRIFARKSLMLVPLTQLLLHYDFRRFCSKACRVVWHGSCFEGRRRCPCFPG